MLEYKSRLPIKIIHDNLIGMKKLMTIFLLAALMALPASAEFVPIVHDDVIYILDTETGETPAMIAEGARFEIFDSREYMDWFLDFQIPDWLRGTWMMGNEGYISFNDDDIVANGESFKRNAASYLLENGDYQTMHKAGSLVTDDMFLLQADRNDKQYFLKTANPNLIVMTFDYPSSRYESNLLFKAGHPYGSTLSFPSWMQGAWQSDAGVDVIITSGDFLVDGNSFAEDILQESLMWVDGLPYLSGDASISEDESEAYLRYFDHTLHVVRMDDPDTLLVSSDLYDRDIILTRISRALW